MVVLKKMSKNLSAKCYQENKEGPQKKACERYQNLFKEKKKPENVLNVMVLNVTKIFQKMKNKSFLSIQKIQNEKKHFITNIRKYFNLENLLLYQGKYKKLFSFVHIFKKFSVNTNKNCEIFYFQVLFSSFLLKYNKFLRLGARKFNFPKYKTFLFIFRSWKFSPEI